ncbi:MAG: methylmalonyl-CoA mutase family protein [Leptospiraceae bacterium]|nr:methylmalonyl-CoA mutase family protein [Leptospiraceae bacterium]MDW8305914.1 methylmalonyl-CoA mutase family protein [Leptospiraceae bacterium]
MPPLRFITAASLFDGHDAAINLMRRILQDYGNEVIHLGHNRSVAEIVKAAIEEDAHAIAVTSYQGGHIEFFRYLYDSLNKAGASEIGIFGGGGGTILPSEIKELMNYGIKRIYSPDDGRQMGLKGMIEDVLSQCQAKKENIFAEMIWQEILQGNRRALARAITLVETGENLPDGPYRERPTPVLGITGTGGAGKSSLCDELLLRFIEDHPQIKIAVLAVDPTRRRTGGALLGDRLRMNQSFKSQVFMRSLGTRGENTSLNQHIDKILRICKMAPFDLIILESAGIGQADAAITHFSDISLYVMTPDYGAPTQLEKIEMLDRADVVAINKFDRLGGEDALKAVQKQLQRNRQAYAQKPHEMPVFGTVASHFRDTGVNRLYEYLLVLLKQKGFSPTRSFFSSQIENPTLPIFIPPHRQNYLTEIAELCRQLKKEALQQARQAQRWEALQLALEELPDEDPLRQKMQELAMAAKKELKADVVDFILQFDEKKKRYVTEEASYQVRDRTITVKNFHITLAHQKIPKIALPTYHSAYEKVLFYYQENFPGEFPYTSGIYPYRRHEEQVARLFAGEGSPERTNHRFHLLSEGIGTPRLSTAFDSPTLYGEDPSERPDIYGKIGNSGVSIATLDDMKKLYSGFRLADPHTSVSMTINGPAPMILAFFFHTAVDQECEIFIEQSDEKNFYIEKIENIRQKKNFYPSYTGKLPPRHNGLGLLLLGVSGKDILPYDIYENIFKTTLRKLRGTVQADILKEDQAQNTCIFSTEFALKLMGDIQEYFTYNQIRNFYSVSISGYHMAEAGANPITQLAFTLANAFTYVEYFLARGLKIDDFAPNLSFFFSNGLDGEYAVIGRVARRIWARALRYLYKANERSQKLKYHIQTSGRSLHAQEMAFNDIRTTLQALYAINDNCNSLHTNAYDEALTTPTEESVRRALAIQLIISQELGLAKNENPLQGSFIIEYLTDLVEEAVLAEFDQLSRRGGVLGAMELGYQRMKIQEESMYYEQLKHSGKLPLIGVNTFLSRDGSPTEVPNNIVRASEEEKKRQIENLLSFQRAHSDKAPHYLEKIKQAARKNQNIFEALLEAAPYCSLGQMTNALYEVGGCYRRSL